MPITSEIQSALRMGKNIGRIKDNYIKKSIARGASDSIMQFPALISDTIPVNMAHVLVRNLDRVYAVFAQTYFSLNSTINISADPTASNYIRKFHQNYLESSIFQEENMNRELIAECIDADLCSLYKNYNGTYGILFSYPESKFELKGANKELLTESEEVIFEADELNPNEVIHNYLQKKKTSEYAQLQRNQKPPELLDRNDIKKANDIQPLTMNVRLMGVNDQDEFVQYVDFICGIKTVLHLIKSQTMCEEIDKSVRGKGRLFNFIRWTTGEISLFKDLLFGVGGIRDDIAARSDNTVPYFSTLRRLKQKRVSLNPLKGITQIIPNATLIISAYEVRYIEDNYGYNIRDIRTATRMMDALLLLAFIIVDEGTETIDILYDGRKSFETYSLDSLEKETIQQSAKLSKELTRMLGSN